MIWIVTSVLIIIVSFFIGRLFPYQTRITKEVDAQVQKKVKNLVGEIQRLKVRYDFIMNRLTERANEKGTKTNKASKES